MNLQKSLERISELMALLVYRVKNDNAMGLLDINRLSEDVLLPVLKDVYGYAHLENLNTDDQNFPGIDLGDKVARVAFQITSEQRSEKIKETLQTFVTHKHYEHYDHLVVYVITEKQGSYSGTGWDKIIQGKFQFDKEADIRDYSDLLKAIRQLPIERVEKVETIVELHLAESARIPVRKLLRTQVSRQLAKEKRSRKYIPDIFTEVAHVKDQLRNFAYPTLFFQKALGELQLMNFDDVNRVRRKLHMQPMSANWEPMPTRVSIDEVYPRIQALQHQLKHIREAALPYAYPWRTSIPPDPLSVPEERRHLLEYMQPYLGGFTSAAIWEIDDLLESLDFMSSRVLFVIAGAGQGKTNLVCNFAETVLAKHDIPCAFLTGRDFNHVAPDRMGEFFAQSLFGDRVSGQDEALDRLEKAAVQSNTPAIIIIDGINEHKDIQAFSHHLERFIERALERKHIKFLLTCRSEYFEHRFNNFKVCSFADQARFINNLERQMSQAHKDQMVRAYFRLFHLRPPFTSQYVTEILEKDTLLLRMFCEAYGDVSAKVDIQIPPIVDIYREKIFREYLDKKIESAAEYEEVSSRIRIRQGEKCRQLLSRIVELMIERQRYSDIPISELPEEYDDALGALLGEDVIVRKDLVSADDAFGNRIEVINFTFDEFRDYLLARQLATNVFRQDPGKFEAIVDQISSPSSRVAEGVRTYLFFVSRQPNARDILGIIRGKQWYTEMFVKCIFSVEDDLVMEEDKELICDKFQESSLYASWIIRMLTFRWRSSLHPRLNIRLLFDIFDSLTEETFDRLVKPCVTAPGVHSFDGHRCWTVKEISNRLMDNSRYEDTSDFQNLMELLVYLFHIVGEPQSSSAAFDAFEAWAKTAPKEAITMLRRHTRSKFRGVRIGVWKMLSRLARLVDPPAELVEEANALMLDAPNQEPLNATPLLTEVAKFLQASSRSQ